VPFNNTFKELRDSYSSPARKTLKDFVAQVPTYQPEDRGTWIEKVEHSKSELPPLVEAVLRADSDGDEAFRLFVKSEKAKLVLELKPLLTKQIQEDPELQSKWMALSRAERDSRLDALVNDLVAEKAAEFENDCSRDWQNILKDLPGAQQAMLEHLLVSTMSQVDKPNRAAVEWWVAMQRTANIAPDKIVQILLAYSNPVTLAALYDDHVSFTLRNDGSTAFSTKLKYFYATSFINASNDHIGATHSPTDPAVEVNPIPRLSALVNSHVDFLVKNYPPLQRIQRYAGLAAFFRWAKNAEQTGELAMIDLGNLAAFPANDREHFPTPDALERR
jgi:hypothetical protein